MDKWVLLALAAVVAWFCIGLRDAQAQEQLWIGFGGPSKHTSGDSNDNERNFGLGFQRSIDREDRWRLVAQTFRNTQRIDSAAVGVAYSPWRWQLGDGVTARLGTFAGGAVGYKPHLIWAALPTASLEGRHFGVDYVLAPEMGGNSKGWVHWLNFKANGNVF